MASLRIHRVKGISPPFRHQVITFIMTRKVKSNSAEDQRIFLGKGARIVKLEGLFESVPFVKFGLLKGRGSKHLLYLVLFVVVVLGYYD